MILNEFIKKNTFTQGPPADLYLELSASSHSHQMGGTQLIPSSWFKCVYVMNCKCSGVSWSMLRSCDDNLANSICLWGLFCKASQWTLHYMEKKKKYPTSLLHCFRFIYCKYLLTSYVKLGQELTLRVEKWNFASKYLGQLLTDIFQMKSFFSFNCCVLFSKTSASCCVMH